MLAYWHSSYNNICYNKNESKITILDKLNKWALTHCKFIN